MYYYKPAICLLFVTLSACTATPSFQEGPDAEMTYDGLTRLEGTIMDAAWARRDIDLTTFNKVMLDDVRFEYRPVSGPVGGREGTTGMRRTSHTEFEIGPNTKPVFEAEIQSAIFDRIAASDKYTIVTEPGPDVLVVQAQLLDVISRVPPEPMGRGTVFVDQVGEATLVLEISDAVSHTVFARAIDRRAAQRTGNDLQESNTVRNKAEVRRLGQRWGNIIRDGLERLLSEPVP